MTLAIIDFNRTIYDPDTEELVTGAAEFLAALAKREICMVLLSRDVGGRLDILDRLGVKGFFSETVFVADKTAAVMRDVMERYGATPKETFVVGDYLYQDIRAGNQAGAFTIQYKQGPLAGRGPQTPDDIPKAVVKNLIDAAAFIT